MTWTASDDLAAEMDMREQAANYCSAYALIDGFHLADLDGFCTSWSARNLAWHARNVAALTTMYSHERWAEAECLIRTGWRVER